MWKILGMSLFCGFLAVGIVRADATMLATFSADRQAITLTDGQIVSLEGLLFNENTVIPIMLFKRPFKVESHAFEEIGMNHNRYGDLYAWLQNPEIGSLQWYLVEKGYAVYSGLGPYPKKFRKELLAAEELARAESNGFWAQKIVLKASDISGVWRGKLFKLVEGRVHSVASTKSGVYLNFGPDRDVDFTAHIPTASKRYFKNADWNYEGLVNKWLRVRGMVRNYNGPFMELYAPEQVELLNVDRKH